MPVTPTITAVGSKHEKGRALERMVGAVWTELGFRKLRFNIHATGEEIDVEGTHVVSTEVLKGQCKAHAEKIDAPPLRQFFGDLEKDRGKTDRLTGIFVSLSGFTGTAERWHEELSEKQRAYFKLYEGTQFISQLEEAGLVVGVTTLLSRLADLTKLEVTKACLLLSERGPFWMVTLGDSKSAEAYYALLTGLAAKPREEDVEYLCARLPALSATTKRISLLGRESVIRVLLRGNTCMVAQVAGEADESTEDIEAVVASLTAEGIVSRTEGNISLREEFDAVATIARMSLGTDLEVAFMTSTFYRDLTKPILIPFIEGKYFVEFEPDETEVVRRILVLSPRALKRVIAGDAERFRNTEEHIRQLNMSPESAVEHRKRSRIGLIDLLTHDLVSDHIDSQITPLLSHHKIVATKTSFDLKISSRKESFLQLHSSWFTMLATAAGAIKAGQLVSSDGPGPIIESADAMMAMQEWDSAIQRYDFIAANWPGTEQAFAAANNKAVCLMALSKLDEAIAVLEPLLEQSTVRESALRNMARCFATSGNAEKSRAALETLRSEFGESAELTGFREEMESLITAKIENS